MLEPLSGIVHVEVLRKAFPMFKQALSINTILSTDAQAVHCCAVYLAESQHYEWATIKNSIIIAVGCVGHINAARTHHLRISSRASAHLLMHMVSLCSSPRTWNMTDDTSGAIVLFNKVLTRSIKANVHLYNSAISKLSHARKAY